MSRFLLVSLKLDSILQETTIHRRRERLRVMTHGLGLEDIYGTALERIKAQGGQKSRLGMASLMWISHSERPFRAEELCHALAIEIESTNYNPDNISSIWTVLSCCQGLVVVDKEGSAVRLVHFTLHEYLTSHPDLFRSPHAVIAKTCLTYLDSPQVITLPASGSLGTQHTPFLEYSAIYWGVHMKKEPTDRGKALALKLLRNYDHHVSIELLLKRAPGYPSVENSYRFTGLHCACMFGLVGVARTLTEMDGVDINCLDDTDATPLIWAARNGHEEVVRLLLGQKDVDPDMLDRFDQAPILWATKHGHEVVVKLLLGRRDVNPNRLDNDGQTLISWAAMNGHEEVVKLLLGQEGVDPDLDLPDYDGQTPISWAAKSGHEGVVKLLLGQEDVDPDRPDYDAQTPISWAAKNGHEVVVRLLLGRRDVNPVVFSL